MNEFVCLGLVAGTFVATCAYEAVQTFKLKREHQKALAILGKAIGEREEALEATRQELVAMTIQAAKWEGLCRSLVQPVTFTAQQGS